MTFFLCLTFIITRSVFALCVSYYTQRGECCQGLVWHKTNQQKGKLHVGMGYFIKYTDTQCISPGKSY